MDFCFNLQELSDTTNGVPGDISRTKLNASCSTTVDDLETFSVSANRSKDCNAKSGENMNVTLAYISQFLLEEDTDEISSYEEQLALTATERNFSDILSQDYYSTPDETLLHGAANKMSSVDGINCKSSNDGGGRELIRNGARYDVYSVKQSLQSADLTSALPIENCIADQIQKGIDEAMKFLPNIGEFFIDGSNRSISGRDWLTKTKKSARYTAFNQLQERLPKQIADYAEMPIRNENIDKLCLLNGQNYFEKDSILRKFMQMEMRDNSRKCRAESSNHAIVQHDVDQTKEKTVDLRSLLIDCSHAISVNDHSVANELICKIRKHSSPNGDWCQRLAYYLVDALEARLAGTASEIYFKILPEKVSGVEFLNAFCMYIVASPFMRAFAYFNNQTIFNNVSKNAQKVHIITYGARHGLQWPSLFEHFSTWESTPPTIRITVIEVPEPGFRPRKRVEEIGQRVADYAKSFNVPFEYEGIVSEWQNVQVEDLKMAKDEVVIVNCVIHSEKLSDEAVHTNSPRDIFLNTIRKIKPRVFIHITFNGSYNSPYFPARFRAALSLYSSFFDMLDSNLTRSNPERLIIENNFLMPAAFNAIAFEGRNRVETGKARDL
ncbi:hypothetical protein LUZ61_017385 [Rhynchospora tenuis]|uniref:Uncharacterized protein n=1 Tax=Rhynchospora tenuis TaxID=198213 RepID=A0AAD5Z7A8_9POAL|nr:hypothetical protein LUZ61_017385 [Rhynchospora tenuis]